MSIDFIIFISLFVGYVAGEFIFNWQTQYIITILNYNKSNNFNYRSTINRGIFVKYFIVFFSCLFASIKNISMFFEFASFFLFLVWVVVIFHLMEVFRFKIKKL